MSPNQASAGAMAVVFALVVAAAGAMIYFAPGPTITGQEPTTNALREYMKSLPEDLTDEQVHHATHTYRLLIIDVEIARLEAERSRMKESVQ